MGGPSLLISGIRRSSAFANSPDVVALCQDPTTYPGYTRARNARLIISNVVPDMQDSLDVFPYCIWHPDFATEQTYSKVARRYPTIRYQVGRAYAAAGYMDLFRKLDLVPDVSIAEETRANSETGQAIFTYIMSKHVKYAVMDDYTRTRE